MNVKTAIILLIIVILATVLRVANLNNFPPGVTGDEIQQGYTGYSILKTGHDEWGDFLPLNPRGFGDYKPPLYAYLTVPSIALFGVNEFAIRFPSALAGILTVIVVFFLTKKFLEKDAYALLASFIYTISWWHINSSRLAWEANVGTLLFVVGFLFFLYGLEKPKHFIWAAFFWGLSLFSYHTFKVFTPLFVLTMIFFYRKQLIHIKKVWTFTAAGVFGIAIVLILWGVLFSGAGRRAADAAIYSEENISALRDVQVSDPLPNPWNRVINNKMEFLASEFIQNYFGYFSPTFYISPFRSDSTLFNLPGMWLIPFWQFLFSMIGLLFVFKKNPPWGKLIWAWLFLAPIPAALTRDYMHTQRVANLLSIIPLITTIGVFATFIWFKKPYKLALFFVLGVVVFGSFIIRADDYLFRYYNKPVGGFKTGYKEIVQYTHERENMYDKIIFTKVNSEPQAFVAFYSQMDPRVYQQNAQKWKYFESSGFKFLDMINYNLGKYEFRDIHWNDDKKLPNTLIVASDQELPDDVKPDFVVKDAQGKIVFEAVDTKYVKN